MNFIRITFVFDLDELNFFLDLIKRMQKFDTSDECLALHQRFDFEKAETIDASCNKNQNGMKIILQFFNQIRRAVQTRIVIDPSNFARFDTA